MAYEKLKRTNYNHSGPHTAKDHYQDQEEFFSPLHRMEASNLAEWGILNGLNVTGTIGSHLLQVKEGVGIDISGQLIPLATGGQADVGANPLGTQNTPPQNELTVVPVTLDAAPYPNKTVHVTIQYSLYYTKSPTDPYDPGDYELIPWVRLQDKALYTNDGTSLILATAEINGSGNITSITGENRKMIAIASGKISLRKPDPTDSAGSFNIKEKVVIEADGATGVLSVGGSGQTGTVQLKNAAGNVTAELSATLANLMLGGNGVEGDVVVKNSAGNLTVALDAQRGLIDVGGTGVAGKMRLRNSSNQITAKMDGQANSLDVASIERGTNALEINARYLRVHGWDLVLDGRSGGNKRALVDYANKLIINFAGDYANGVEVQSNLSSIGNLSANGNISATGNVSSGGKILGANPSRQTIYRWLGADSGTDTQTIDLGTSRRFTAFVAIAGMNPRHDFDRGDCFAVDIYSVDGESTGNWRWGGDHLGPFGDYNNVRALSYSGTGRSITFRARSFQDAEVWAIGVVIYE